MQRGKRANAEGAIRKTSKKAHGETQRALIPVPFLFIKRNCGKSLFFQGIAMIKVNRKSAEKKVFSVCFLCKGEKNVKITYR